MIDRVRSAQIRFLESYWDFSPLAYPVEEVCESPIERELFLYLATCAVNSGLGLRVGAGNGREHEVYVWPIMAAQSRPSLDIGVQVSVGDYRVDIALRLRDSLNGQKLTPLVTVECDGHDYHERTKEQAMRDRSRDRALQAAGHPVFRYTGAEIYRHPEKCARQCTTFVLSLAEEEREAESVSQ